MRATITTTPITARSLLTPTQWTDLQSRNTSNGKNTSICVIPEGVVRRYNTSYQPTPPVITDCITIPVSGLVLTVAKMENLAFIAEAPSDILYDFLG